jgi:predicted GH43/DUF377 family glycosyl hydrolase
VGLISYSGNFDNNIVINNGTPGSWNEATSYLPTVLKDDSGYKMWFTGAQSNVLSIGYATSPDGVTWTEHPGNPVISAGSYWWENTDIHTPAVINNSGLYEMWYTGVQNNQIGWIGYANSTDGITWTKHSEYVLGSGPSVWDAGEVFNPSVIKMGDLYEMWYVGIHAIDAMTLQIGYATSNNGINWTKHNDPVLSPGINGQWDDYVVNNHCVIVDDATYKMWYSGYNQISEVRIGYAEAPTDATQIGPDIPVTLASGESTTVSVEWTAPSVSKTYNIFVTVEEIVPIDGDLSNNIFNNTIEVNGTPSAEPDLSIVSSDIWFSTTLPQEGDPVRIYSKIYNHGGVDATYAKISFYDGNPDSGGALIGFTSGVFASGYATVEFVDWTAVGGYHDIYVKITDVTPSEAVLGNNMAFKDIYVNKDPIVVLSIPSQSLPLL